MNTQKIVSFVLATALSFGAAAAVVTTTTSTTHVDPVTGIWHATGDVVRGVGHMATDTWNGVVHGTKTVVHSTAHAVDNGATTVKRTTTKVYH